MKDPCKKLYRREMDRRKREEKEKKKKEGRRSMNMFDEWAGQKWEREKNN